MKKIKEIDLTKILKPYVNKDIWVALNRSQTRVLASGKTINEVVESAKKISNEKPILMRTKQEYESYAPCYIL